MCECVIVYPAALWPRGLLLSSSTSSFSQRRGAAGKEVISVLRSSSALSEDILLRPTLKFQGFFCFSFPLLLLFFFFFPLTGSVYFCASLRVFFFFYARVCVELRIISGISIQCGFLGIFSINARFHPELFVVCPRSEHLHGTFKERPGRFRANDRLAFIWTESFSSLFLRARHISRCHDGERMSPHIACQVSPRRFLRSY